MHFQEMKDQIVVRACVSCSILVKAILDTRQKSCQHETKMNIELTTVFQCFMIFTYLMEYSSVFHLQVNHIGAISN